VKLVPKVIFEIGTGGFDFVRSTGFWSDSNLDTKCYLFDPLLKHAAEIINHIDKYKIVNVYFDLCAIADEDKESFIYDLNECSYLVDEFNLVHHQSGEHDRYIKNEVSKILVICARIDNFDKGDIDLLLIDTEGTEWYTLKYLVSRPALIVIETHMMLPGCRFYRNPYINEINDWMKVNNYKLVLRDDSDSYFIRADFLDRRDEILAWLD